MELQISPEGRQQCPLYFVEDYITILLPEDAVYLSLAQLHWGCKVDLALKLLAIIGFKYELSKLKSTPVNLYSIYLI